MIYRNELPSSMKPYTFLPLNMRHPQIITEFSSIQQRHIHCKNMVFLRCDEFRLPEMTIHADNVFYHHCNKSFIYHNMVPASHSGPLCEVKNIYLHSLPCDKRIFERFQESDVKINIFLSKQYEKYKKMYAPDMENVHVIWLETYRSKFESVMRELGVKIDVDDL